MPTERQAWKRVLDDWDVGPACGLAAARRFVEEFPDRFHGWVAVAHHMSELGRYTDAAKALRKAQRLAPASARPRIWEQWGLMYRTSNDLPRAERWFRKALAAGPTTRRHILLGATLARRGRLVEALEEHRAAITLASPDGEVDEAHLNAALVPRALERYEEARDHLREAIRLDRRYKDALNALRDIKGVLLRRGVAG